MTCQKSRNGSPSAAAATLGLIVLAASACVHRPYIQQGNYLESEDVDQVTAGMTRSQVRYVLGTPMISDPFTAQRWDYIYTLKRGRERRIDRAHFVVYFTDDKVSRVERLDAPEENRGIETGLPEVERSEEEMARPAPRDEDKAPAPQPEPEAPRPDQG
jgi:outer membrane protein assembly factor BamE